MLTIKMLKSSRPAKRVYRCSPQLLHVGAEARTALREWAEEEGVSVNAIVVSVLEEFFKRLKRRKALREELRLEIRARRGFLPS